MRSRFDSLLCSFVFHYLCATSLFVYVSEKVKDRDGKREEAGGRGPGAGGRGL